MNPVKLYNKDNLEVLKEFKDRSVDGYIFDPLFNSNRLYLSNPDDSGDVSKMNDVWKGGDSSYLNDLDLRFKEMYRTLTERGLIICHCDDTMGFGIRDLLEENGFICRSRITWSYSGGGIPRNDLPSKDDLIWVFMKSKNKNLWVYHQIMRHYADSTKGVGKHSTRSGSGDSINIDLEKGTPLTRVWDSRSEESDREKAKREGWGWVFNPDFGSIKPRTGWAGPKGNTEKPEAVYSRLVYLYTDPDFLIVDPYMGSGTTLVAAHGLGREVIGIDYEFEAYKRVKKRLKTQSILYVEDETSAFINTDIDPNTMTSFEWERYYVVMAGGKGTPRSKDGGVDGVKKDSQTFIECKKHKNPVGVGDIRKFKTSIEIEGKKRGWKKANGIYISYNGYTKNAQVLAADLKRNHNMSIILKTAHDVEEERYEGRSLVLNLIRNGNIIKAEISGLHRTISKYVWLLTSKGQIYLFTDDGGVEKKVVKTTSNTLDMSTIKNYKAYDKLECKVYDIKGDKTSREMLL